MVAPPSRSRGRAARLVEIGVDNSLLVVLVAALGTMLLGLAPQILVGDSWMTLVAGREIVQHGLPGREALTVIPSGRTWTDQQWLAQLAFYGAYAAAGLRATLLLHVVLVTAATAIAIGAARRRGATARSTLPVVAAGLLVAPWSWTLRAQAVALPLFVVTLALLASDRELRRRRTLLVFPLLVLWANVHGSVVLGAAIATWAGLIGLGELMLGRPTRATARRCAALVLLPWACVLATPYGTAVAGYYKLMFVDSPVAKAVTEWQAPKPHGYQIAFFVVALLTVAVAVMGRRRLSLFDLGVLALTLAGSLRSARGIVWFALALSVLLPVALDAVLPPDRAPVRRRTGLVLCVAACVTLATAVAVWVPRGDGWYASEWSSEGARAVEAALPGLPAGRAVLPSDRHADWLLWKVPSLRGRIAYDIRFELLDDRELATLALFKAVRPGWQRAAAAYPIVVVDPTEDRRRVAILRRQGMRLLYRGRGMVVLARGSSAAGAAA
ncbi:hypothetical protein [Gaiella occulta]|uniref:hypothetical protein n=1 Tax=Gaiella occulta TaxID=1002870 RepID=UPI0015F0082C|nr:hypothetical protein [Gaiella occulta]